LQPGRIFLIDFNQGRMIPDEELKNGLASAQPYQQWIADNRIELDEIPKQTGLGVDSSSLTQRMQAFGYTQETMQFMLEPML
jgi:glutamate synthase (NADPH/NADH) large chain